MSDETDISKVIEDVKRSVDIVEVIGADTAIRGSGNRLKALCTLHAEKTPSLHIDPHKQRFHCFGCGEGGDVINYVQKTRNLGIRDTIEYLGGTLDAEPQFKKTKEYKAVADPIKKRFDLVPDRAHVFNKGTKSPWVFNPRNPQRAFTKYEPAAVYPYKTLDGKRLLGYVIREEWQKKGGKKSKFTPTVTYCEFDHEGKTKKGFALVAFDHGGALKPLYKQEYLQKIPDEIVFMHEGEQCADGGAVLLPEHPHIAWPGGTNGLLSHDKTKSLVDFSPLRGRRVFYVPDNDMPGFKAAGEIVALSLMYEFELMVVVPPTNAPEGWDIDDARVAGWTGNEFLERVVFSNSVKGTDFVKTNQVAREAFWACNLEEAAPAAMACGM